jgi:flagellar hook-basal body complex protein FliE
MMVEAIAATAVAQADMLPAVGVAAPQAAPGFAGWFASELGAVNSSLVGADHEVQKLAVGEAGNLHEVMIHLEEARLSFQLLAQVRNRMLEAYQEVMRMQV